jgi:hypothetical protein
MGMKKFNMWLCEQSEDGITLENVTLMLNGNKLMIECEDGNSFDLELDEEQAADLNEKMSGCSAAGEEGEENPEEIDGMADQTPAPPQQMRPGLGEGKLNFGKLCAKCKKIKCVCKKKCGM